MPTGNKNLTRCKLCRSLRKVVFLNTSELPPSVAASLRLIPAYAFVDLEYAPCNFTSFYRPSRIYL